MISDTYAKFHSQFKYLATDEATVQFKSRVIFKQYVPKEHKHSGT
jgi:hypothetical protein